ncbi:MAG TPA: acyltransferase [Candidatus Methylacidiphilales bacterium]|nr:acyltransferase [Candidatus Methylacidiphilales bacterium]
MDFLRAMAVLLVVFHHSLNFMAVPAWVWHFGWLGEIGVGALLVLSGYLIGQSLMLKCRAGRFSRLGDLGNFYMRRWSRTFPPYFFFLGMMAALFPPVLGQLQAHWQYFLFLQNFAWDTPPFYCQTWTLALLEFFYLLFPLLMMAAWKLTRSYALSVAVPMVVLFFVPLGLRALAPLEPQERVEAMFRTWVIYRLDTPIIGVLAALVQVELPRLWALLLRHSWIGLLACAGLLAYHEAGCPGVSTSHALQVVFYPLSAVAMATALPWLVNWRQNPSLAGKVISSVSSTSYTLYVSQFFAMIIGFCFLGVVGISAWYLALPILAMFVAVVTCAGYYVTEEPFIRLREKKSRSCFAPLVRAAFGLRARLALRPVLVPAEGEGETAKGVSGQELVDRIETLFTPEEAADLARRIEEGRANRHD